MTNYYENVPLEEFESILAAIEEEHRQVHPNETKEEVKRG